MMLAVDTYYTENKAKTVALGFRDWQTETDYETWTEIREGIEDYTPGEFYKRELPCILSILKIIPPPIEIIIVDGYVYLDDQQKPGLGAHLYAALEGRIPVIGVAKTNFASLEKNKRAVLRGESKNPLYITAAGLDMDKAAAFIESMTGPYRIPALLKTLDSLTKA